MTLSIEIIGTSVPRATRLTLTCDSDHGLFPISASFEHPHGFMVQYRAAMNAGWKDTHRDGARVFFGPCCSRKAVA